MVMPACSLARQRRSPHSWARPPRRSPHSSACRRPRAKAGDDGELPRPGRASNAPRVIPAALRLALNSDQVRITYVGPLDLPDREPAARAHRDRLQRLCAPAGAARHRHHEPRALHALTPIIPIRASRTCCAAGGRARTSRRATTSRCATCACATCRPTSATGAAAPSGTATRSSSSRWRTCASPISAICITRSTSSSSTRSAASTCVFVPVDGNMTLDLEGMIEVLQAIKAPLMVPMHYFSTYTLHRFLDRVREQKWDGGDEPTSPRSWCRRRRCRPRPRSGAAGALRRRRRSAQRMQVEQPR